MLTFNRILVPVDFSDEAALAVSWANRFAADADRPTIVLMNVPLPQPVIAGPYDIPSTMEPLRDEARTRLDQWRTRIKAGIACETIVGHGDPADDIVSYCESNAVDLVVMTTKGRRGLNRLVHPNLSETIVRRSPCPVMVLHLNDRTARLGEAEKIPASHPSWRDYAEDYDAD